MNHLSIWTDDTGFPSFPQLETNVQTDVVVVGGGIAGLTACLLLQRAGKRVVLIEARSIGSGETGHTTAHLTELVDARYHDLESKFGRDGARLSAESSRAAIARIEAFAGEFGVGCGFARLPAYLYAESEKQKIELEEEFESLQRVGSEVSWVDGISLALDVAAAIRVERQAQFHPLKYLREMAALFVGAGGRIFERTRMLNVVDGEPCEVTTTGGKIAAQDVVVVTNEAASNKFALHTKVAAYRSYALAARLTKPFPSGLYWDMQDPYHYIRSEETSSGVFLIVGGEDHKTGQNADTRDSFRRLGEYTTTHFQGVEITHRWSGQIIEPADGLPFIGKNSGNEHVYVATGFSGTGMTFGTLSGMMLSDAILGVKNPWAELYDATRVKPLAMARDYVVENVDFPAYLARDRLARGDAESIDHVAPGEGCLIRSRGNMVAVYRDEAGAVHARSAVCTHLGCYVRWNKAERSWDCPCHGSRFDVDGAVLNGPATRALEEADISLEKAPVQHAKRKERLA